MKSWVLAERNLKCALMVAAATIAGALQAQDAAPTQPTQGAGASKMQTPDAATFIKAASQANLAEVRLAELAARKSKNADVKTFAEQLQKDHAEANRILQPIAEAHAVTLSPTVDAKQQKTYDQLEQLSGSQFDQAYVKEMLRDHQQDIGKFEKAAQQLTAPDVKQYARSTLPTLRKHLENAKDTARTVGIDQATVSSILKESSAGMGGTGEDSQKESGAGNKTEKGDQN